MTINPDIWMPIYIGDYLADTMHLSTEEHGGYLLAIMHYWKNGGAFPKNSLVNIMRTKHEQTFDAVLAFFTEEAGMLYHKRIDEELKKANNNTVARSNAGKKSGEARRLKKQANEQNANKMRTKDEQNTKPSPSPSPSPPSLPSQTPKGGVLEVFGGKKKYDVNLYLNDTGRAYAKLNAPDWDMYYLIGVYNEGISAGKRSPPDNANAAFPAWCKKYTKGRSP